MPSPYVLRGGRAGDADLIQHLELNRRQPDLAGPDRQQRAQGKTGSPMNVL